MRRRIADLQRGRGRLSLTRERTLTLSLVALGLVAADVWAATASQSANAPLEASPAFDAAQITEVRLSQGDSRLSIQSSDAAWPQMAPVIERFSTGIYPFALVDRNQLAPYGLTNAEDVRVTFLAGPDTLSSVVIGREAPSGGHFVRWANQQTVYRADVGGRADLAIEHWTP